MQVVQPENYDHLSPSDAVVLQKQLRQQIDLTPLRKPIRLIGGANISFNKFEDTVYAGVIILKFPDMTPVETISIAAHTKFPYISGLLAFREIPALLQAWKKIETKPDLMVLDGQGIAHGRRMGIATHFGLLTNVPSIGCAKSRLTGTFVEPDNKLFAENPLIDKQEQIGVVLKSKLNCKPLFISPGHRISIQQSVDIIKKCVGKYRIPEPTRLAHNLVNEARIAAKLNSNPKLY